MRLISGGNGLKRSCTAALRGRVAAAVVLRLLLLASGSDCSAEVEENIRSDKKTGRCIWELIAVEMQCRRSGCKNEVFTRCLAPSR